LVLAEVGSLLKREGLVVAHKKRLRTAPYCEPLAHADAANRVFQVCLSNSDRLIVPLSASRIESVGGPRSKATIAFGRIRPRERQVFG